MGISKIKHFLKHNARLKSLVHWLIIPTNEHKPRLWVHIFLNPFIHSVKGKIRKSVRKDLFPFQPFSVGRNARIEDFSVLNNGVGPLEIGEGSRIGIGNVLIGPIKVGKSCLTAQNIVISGLNHNYKDTLKPILAQGINTNPVTLKDGCWIGANSTIVAGVTIGKNAVIGAGSVVTKDVPDYAVAVGNPAKVVKTLKEERNIPAENNFILHKSA